MPFTFSGLNVCQTWRYRVFVPGSKQISAIRMPSTIVFATDMGLGPNVNRGAHFSRKPDGVAYVKSREKVSIRNWA